MPNASADDRLDVRGMVPVAFALHHFCVGFVNEAAGVLDCLLFGHVEAPVRHVHHTQAKFRAAVDRFRHHHDFVEADADCALMTKQDHAAGVGNAEDVHTETIGDHRSAIVIGGELRNRLAFSHLRHQRWDGDFFSRRRVGHDLFLS